MVASIPNDIFQFSTHAALAAGFATGQPRTADLSSHGNHGIGTYEDGNLMLLINEKIYSIRKDGTAVPAPPDARLPFAMVTNFHPAYRIKLPSLTLEGLDELLSSTELGPARAINTLVPFKLSGVFESMRLEQGGERANVEGTVFGFVVPDWMREMSGPRVHAHFVDETEAKGGKVVDFEIDEEVQFGFAKCGRFHMGFPQSRNWEEVRLSRR